MHYSDIGNVLIQTVSFIKVNKYFRIKINIVDKAALICFMLRFWAFN
ncbi:hypothetical protein SAMN05443633_11047 [Chryseobacterium arachidis]|uniref:Uncharacterized protein n=1 Tax=Chryseobacterium arachidis TaxID=1416778 RepID=A0A1M5H1K4_9FLAO|nr:hypothetical protein SAMN05443633_11047 [Chryseobacterium arachidis]